MKALHVFAAGLALSTAAAASAAAAAKSDLLPPAKRHTSVETAERLAHRKQPAPLPAELPSPFNPPDFDKPDAPAPGTHPVAGPKPAIAQPAVAAPQGPASDREILETVAARIPSTGTFVFRGKPLLIVGKEKLEVGATLVVSYDGKDYELELVSIDRTTYTLRYRGEETTRPIRSVK